MMLGDWATERPYKDYLPYLVAKGGLTTLTLALARELAPHVPVALIQPAMIDPPPDMTESEINRRARPDAPAPLRLLPGRQPADSLPAGRHQFRHRLMLPCRRRKVSGGLVVSDQFRAPSSALRRVSRFGYSPGTTGKITCEGWS